MMLRWVGHVQRNDGGYTGQRRLNMELEEIHGCSEDMKGDSVTEEHGALERKMFKQNLHLTFNNCYLTLT